MTSPWNCSSPATPPGPAGPPCPVLQALTAVNSAFFKEGKYSVGLFSLGVPAFPIYCEFCLAPAAKIVQEHK